MIKEQLKFYADTPRGEKNKYHCYACSLLHLQETLSRFFEKGYNVRAAWYQSLDTETGAVISNERIDVPKLFDEFYDNHIKSKKHRIKGRIKGQIKL
jgi:hypothetical protein